MKTEIMAASLPNALNHALDVLHRGGVVAFPTDTVYGLAALAFQEEGIQRLYSIKGRNQTKAIAVLIHDVRELEQIAVDIPAAAFDLADRFWPGPLTMVLPRHPDVPEALSSNPTIGVRVPDHPVALDLLRLTGPLGVTSANLAGGKNTRDAADVLTQLEGRVHLVIDGGRSPGGVPSTVIDCTKADLTILRPGPISSADIWSVLAG
ncbi:MAG: L-threonylcarbamoyladenylate synthase [Anaerolineae bacterium]|nr:L-threonylcarbamoyladenylate synthase [Anaerolineae bacterium]